MLSNDMETRQNPVNLRYSSPRFNRTKFQPYDPFTLPQTPKTRSRPVSPEFELANGLSPLYPTISRPESRDGRLPRSLIRSTNLPSPRISSPQYNFRHVSSPLPMRGSSSRGDTPNYPVLRVRSMRYSRNSRSRSPQGRYNLDYDSSLSQIYPSFSRPKSSLSPTDYIYGHRRMVDPSSSGSVLASPRPRYHPRAYLQDLSSTFYSPPTDRLSPKPEFAIQDSRESKLLRTSSPASPSEDSQSFFAPKPLPRSDATILFHETSDVESRHTPEMHSIPFTTSSRNLKHDLDSQIACASMSVGNLLIPQVDESERFTRLKDYMKFFVIDTLPRQLYLLFLFRLPALYFLRVARIFEEADLTPEEIGEMALDAVTANGDGQEDLNTNPAYDRLKKAWELLITRFVREWETFNVVSVLLLPAIVTIFQIDGATNDPITRYMAFWSLICALLSSLYDCLFIICFPTMRKPHKAAAWAFEALKSQKIFWNVWVMLAMPAVWICWSILTFIVCIMSFMWRSKAELPPDHQFSVTPSTELGMRIFICVVLGMGVAYGFLIFTTLNRFGSGMDRAWRLRAEAFLAPPIPRTIARSPPEYRATEQPVAGGTGPTRPTEQRSVSPSRDQIIRHSTPDSSNSLPAYPPPPNPTTPSKKKLNRRFAAPPSPPPTTHRSSVRHKNPPSGRADIPRGPPSAHSVSAHQRQTFSGSRSSDAQKVLDGERGRSPINHSHSRSHLRNQADYVVGMSRTLQDSPQVRVEQPDDKKKGHRISRDSFLLNFSTNDGEILLHDIHDRHQAKLSR